jgi:hypothetical protein
LKILQHADLEIGDTAALESCATAERPSCTSTATHQVFTYLQIEEVSDKVVRKCGEVLINEGIQVQFHSPAP